MRIGYLMVCLCAFLLSGCDLVKTEDTEDQYPTILQKKTAQEQYILLEEYKSDNPHLCAEINEYGLNGDKICTDREILRVEIKDEERIKEMAREFLERNRKFTNVFDGTQLDIEKSSGMTGCLKCDGSEGDVATIGWKLKFKNQTYKGLEVKNTKVSVFLDAEKVYRVYGHWYNDIVVPSDDRLDYEAARDTLVGKELTYNDGSGTKTYVVTKDSFGDYENKVIMPYKTERGLEMRVCLVVSSGEWWHLYVDSTTGEFIHKELLVYW